MKLLKQTKTKVKLKLKIQNSQNYNNSLLHTQLVDRVCFFSSLMYFVFMLCLCASVQKYFTGIDSVCNVGQQHPIITPRGALYLGLFYGC